MPGALTWDPLKPGGSMNTSARSGGIDTPAGTLGAPVVIDAVGNGSAAGSALINLAARTPTAMYLDCLCDDGVNIAKDRSGRGRHIVPASGAATPWANAGYFTTTAAASGTGYIPLARFGVDMQVDSFFLSFVINTAATGGSNKTVCGFGNASTGYGMYFSARDPSGTIVPIINAAGGAYTALVSGYNWGSQCDGADHHLAVAYDAPSRSLYYWIDGKLVCVAPNVLNPTGPSASSVDFTLGGNNGAGSTAVVCKFKNVRMLKFPSAGLPLNISEIARKSYLRPDLTLAPSDIYGPPFKRLVLAWVGQSNEAGASDYPDFTVGGVGSPQTDTVLPSGLSSITSANTATPATTSSWHPALSRLLGERGVWLDTINTARGTTSLAQMWAGMFSAWAATTLFGLGAYVIAASKIYKLTATTGSGSGNSNLAQTAGSPPAWPSSGTVTDGDATWTFLRAATAADLIGTVMDMSNPLFDPQGYLTNATNSPANLAGIMSYLPQRAVGDKAIAISIGQGDKTVGTTRSQYKDAIVNITNWALSKGWKVFIGLTCDGTSAGYSAYLSGVLQPAKNDALAMFGGNPNVFAGADLLADLGTLTVTTTTIGLKADTLHLNVFARDAAAIAWDAKFAVAGY